jgi:CRP/FNR family transcriptional regulator
MLYGVEPGQSCIQTTLGLMADEPYSAEAIATTEVRLIAVPRALFQELIDGEPAFRGFVLRAFARRMADMTRLLERVAFARVEARLAEALLALARAGEVQATHADLAARIGSAREVVSRRLEAFARAGWVATDRGHVRLLDPSALRRLAASMA